MATNANPSWRCAHG